MLPWNRWVDGEKIVDGLSRFEKIDKRLDRYPTVGKARRTVENIFVDSQNAC